MLPLSILDLSPIVEGNLVIVSTVTDGFADIASPVPHIREGRLTALGTTGSRRWPATQNVARLTEQGFKFDADGWYGIFAPPGTSPEFVARLNRELKDILSLPDVRTAFETQGMDPAASSADDFRKLVEQDAQRWADVIKRQNITAE